MTPERKAELAVLVDQAIELEKQIKDSTKKLEAAKASLQTAAVEEMDNKNLKWLQIFGANGQFNISQKEKFEIDDYFMLHRILGEIAEAKITRKAEIKYSADARFKEALIVLFKEDYASTPAIDSILQGLGLDDKTIKSAKKRLKGDYLKDRKVLESVGVTGECEEELDAIRLFKNAELIDRFFSKCSPEELGQIRKAVFVEDSIGVGLEYEK